MNAVLMEMMRPELQASENVGRIKGAVEILRKLRHEDKEIETAIIEEYGLTAEEAAKYLQD